MPISDQRKAQLRTILRVFAAFGFVAIGVQHFLNEELFLAIMPQWIPFHRFCVWFSGAAEIAGGIGLLFEKTRRAAGYGLLLLLIAVFPANIHMAVNNIQLPGAAPLPQAALWIRLPFQLVLGIWVWWTAVAQPERQVAEADSESGPV